jgi:hypothetical protein
MEWQLFRMPVKLPDRPGCIIAGFSRAQCHANAEKSPDGSLDGQRRISLSVFLTYSPPSKAET